jgi:hypothetical protein
LQAEKGTRKSDFACITLLCGGLPFFVFLRQQSATLPQVSPKLAGKSSNPYFCNSKTPEFQLEVWPVRRSTRTRI